MTLPPYPSLILLCLACLGCSSDNKSLPGAANETAFKEDAPDLALREIVEDLHLAVANGDTLAMARVLDDSVRAYWPGLPAVEGASAVMRTLSEQLAPSPEAELRLLDVAATTRMGYILVERAGERWFLVFTKDRAGSWVIDRFMLQAAR